MTVQLAVMLLKYQKKMKLKFISYLISRPGRDLIYSMQCQKKRFGRKFSAYCCCSHQSGADYLLTWNCTHTGNAERRNLIAEVCHKNGFEIPVICTPEELKGE